VLGCGAAGVSELRHGGKGRKLSGRGHGIFTVCECHRGPPEAVLITSPFHRAPRESGIAPAVAPI
ncbi:MAG: hypothetical protein WCA59_03815, partial [Candidatus Binataceae bacterium]